MSKNKMKKESKLKKKIREMKETTKGKAILKLIGWGIFFFVLFIFLVISSIVSVESNNLNDNKEPEVNVNESFDEKKVIKELRDNLLNSNYDYNFEIIDDAEKYVFEGNKNNTINQGYKTTKDGIVKYYIQDGIIYELLNGEKVLNENLLDENEKNYINVEYFLNLIDISKLNNIPCNCLYDIYNYKDDLINCTIYFAKFLEEADNSITNITITSENYSYTLTFRNVGSN
ncbi:MAG: hypothetical protein E7163_05165 [Firmicutes bacterium]|nr:hypothetical protein [Bacillota bacterium]